MHGLVEGVGAEVDERDAREEVFGAVGEGRVGRVFGRLGGGEVVEREVRGLLLVGGDPAGPGVEGGDGAVEGDVLVVVPVVELVQGDGGAGLGVDEEEAGHVVERG